MDTAILCHSNALSFGTEFNWNQRIDTLIDDAAFYALIPVPAGESSPDVAVS